MERIRLERVRKNDIRYQEVRSRHYVENHGAVGQQIHYLIWIDHKICGIISGGSAAYAVRCRDDFFGITKENRNVALNGIVDNTVFRLERNEPNLGTQILASWRRRIAADWWDTYGVRVAGFETFVVEEPHRKGKIYLADNWEFVGWTEGSTKFHQHGITKEFLRIQTGKKLVFCKRVKGVPLPEKYVATWNLRRGVMRGQMSLCDLCGEDEEKLKWS